MQQLQLSRHFAGILSTFCLLFFCQNLMAQATLSIQGIIRKSNGAAVDDGKYDLAFKLYNVTSGGTALHTETQNVSVVGGIYSAELGSSTPLTAAFNQTYYLGVSVDGGAELIPRARLTSSPYALSLLGTSNLFPGTGAVGVGTLSPSSGYQMHLANASGAGKLLVEGSDGAQLDFKKGNTAATVGFGSANNNFVVNPGANNTTFQYNGTTKLTVNNDGIAVNGSITGFSPATMTVTSKLAVGQANVDASAAFKVAGTSILAGFLDVTVGGSASGGSHWYYGGGGAGSSGSFSGTNLSIRGVGAVHAEVFRATSDRRIKKDLQESNAATDLSLLLRLKVTNYNYVDVKKSGNTLTKGFIAQEVAQVFPQAVNFSTDFIPNAYALSAKTALTAGKMTISLEKNHDFAIGDEVKLMMPDGEKIVTVAEVPTENSFLVNWDAPAADRVFVYGKKVKDFHTVDYDRIFTLNVSATQELARKVEFLEKENAGLKTQLLKKEEESKASAEKMEARLRALENRLSN